MLSKINDVLLFLFREGGRSLISIEKSVILSAAEWLGPKVLEKVKQQLEEKFFIERTNNRVSVFRFVNRHERCALELPDFADRLVKVRLDVDGKPEVAQVTFYKGFIFSVEFKGPHKQYGKRDVRVIEVFEGKPSDSYTIEIDRSEHDSDP